MIKVTKGPKRVAEFWDYFDPVKTENVDGYKCNIENCIFVNKGRNTTTLKRHLRNFHADIYNEIENKKLKKDCKIVKNNKSFCTYTNF